MGKANLDRAITDTDKRNFICCFDYNKEEGKLYWKASVGSVKKGTEAGTTDPDGYRRVLINKKSFAVHHIIWFLETGELAIDLDHEDRNKQNNRFNNLRKISRSDNCLNKPLQSNNTSGYKGVHWSDNQGWVVQMRKKGKPSIRKTFATKEQAIEFRKCIENDYYGEFYTSK